MTEKLKKMLREAKSREEAYNIICAHGDELSMDDQLNIFHLVYGKSELENTETDIATSNSWFKITFNKVSEWCSEKLRLLRPHV